MTNEEAYRYIDNLKWLKGYDNTKIGGKPVGEILDEIKVLLKEQEEQIDEISDEYLDLGKEMAKQPKIVRCKDCAFYADSENCPIFGMDRYGDWYCADGERRSEEKEIYMARYVKLEDIRSFPIRIDHCDHKNGNIHFMLGIETVMEYIDYLPQYELPEADPIDRLDFSYKNRKQSE